MKAKLSLECKGTVWYRYHAATNRVCTCRFHWLQLRYLYRRGVRTSLSNLTLVACDDDVFGDLYSGLLFAATAGTTITSRWLGTQGQSITPIQPQPGGLLQFHLTSFEDVPSTHWAWGYIEGIYAFGITTGCSSVPLLYCPANIVTRDQMAVFLLRGKYGPGYAPPRWEPAPASWMSRPITGQPPGWNNWPQKGLRAAAAAATTARATLSPVTRWRSSCCGPSTDPGTAAGCHRQIC